MKVYSTRLAATALVVSVCCLLSGCGDSVGDKVAAMNKTKLQKLYNLYKLYSQSNAFRGPKDKEQLLEFISREAYKTNLERMKVDRENLEDLFQNERDGKPFKIRWGINGFGDKAVIFEEEGVDSQRWVALQEPREVGEQEYEDLWTGKQRVKTELPPQEEPIPAAN